MRRNTLEAVLPMAMTTDTLRELLEWLRKDAVGHRRCAADMKEGTEFEVGHKSYAEKREGQAEALEQLLAQSEWRSELRSVLREHWLAEIRCNHEKRTDRA